MAKYKLTHKAASDLADIWDYTIKTGLKIKHVILSTVNDDLPESSA